MSDPGEDAMRQAERAAAEQLVNEVSKVQPMIARFHKMQFDAYLAAGFTELQAIALIAEINNRRNGRR